MSISIASEDYEGMRDWFAFVSQKIIGDYLRPETDPMTGLDELATKSPAKAREGLAMAINDIVELTSRLPDDQVADLDRQLLAEGLPTLSNVRWKFSKTVQRVIRRGRIQDEVEYHAVRNAAELGGDSEQHWKLIAAYEKQASGS